MSWDNLLLAYRKARRGKSRQSEVATFTFDLESQLTAIRRGLQDRTYRPGPYRQFQVVDRKPRCISAAPFRDRVVQHAVMNIVEPLVEPQFIDDCYASRKAKGVHAAVRRYRHWARRYKYVLKVDVSRYFDSMDHALLKQKLRRLVPDRNVLWLLEGIIDSSPAPTDPRLARLSGEDLIDTMTRAVGLPLGNITSQFFGNLYLNDLDHSLQRDLGVDAYLRYVDDLVLLADSKTQLWHWCDSIEMLLQREGLVLHPKKRLLAPTRVGIDVLGYRVFPMQTRLGRGSGYRFRRQLKRMAHAYAQGRVDWEAIDARVQGWLGHAKQADTLGLRRAVLCKVCFRAGDRAVPSAGDSWRFVEQRTSEPSIVQP